MKLLTLVLSILLLATATRATHLRCGNIIVHQKSPGSRIAKITVQVWTNTQTSVLFGGDQDILVFGDGTTLTIPETQNQILSEAPYLGFASYTVEHTYPAIGRYVVSYRAPNRNTAVVNFDNSVNTTMYLESEFHLLGDRKYSSPMPLAPPFFSSYTSTPFSHSIAAMDSNDFALRYVMIPLLSDRNTQVMNYRRPTSMSLLEHEGLLTWDNVFFGQTVVGEYVVGARIEQYIWTDNGWARVGYMYRDYQIIVSDDVIQNPNVQTDQSQTKVVVAENQEHTFRVILSKSESAEYSMELNTELTEDNYSIELYDSAKDESVFKVARVTLYSTADIIRNNPYIINIRSTMKENERTIVTDKNFSFFTKPVDFFEPLGPVLPTGTHDHENGKIFSVYPNPTNGYLHIVGLQPTDVIRLYSSKGEFVLECPAGPQLKLDFTALPPGVYLMRCQSKTVGAMSATKIVKL